MSVKKNPGRPADEEVQRRLGIVERAISERGWSLQLKRALSSELGVSQQTVDNYRRRLIDAMKDDIGGADRATRRAEFISRLRGHQRAALASGRLGPLAAMMNIESRIMGIDGQEAQHDPVGQMGPGELIDKLAGSLTIEHLDQIRARMEGRGE